MSDDSPRRDTPLWVVPLGVGLLAGVGLALLGSLGWAVRVLVTGAVVPLAMLAAIVLRQRSKLHLRADYLAAHPDLERARCEGCESPHLVYPEPKRVRCLACQQDVMDDPEAEAAAERRAEIDHLTPDARVAGAVEDLQRAYEWLQLVTAKSQELPGFLTIDFLSSYRQNQAD